MTARPPTGARHAPCADHIRHPYPSNGWLCVADIPGRAADMVAFADHLSRVAAEHRERELARRAIPADGSHARLLSEARAAGIDVCTSAKKCLLGPAWHMHREAPVPEPEPDVEAIRRLAAALTARKAAKQSPAAAPAPVTRKAASASEPKAPKREPAAAPPTAPEPKRPTATRERPTCPRCGQTFRMSGIGLAWHLANRPSCASQSRRATAA